MPSPTSSTNGNGPASSVGRTEPLSSMRVSASTLALLDRAALYVAKGIVARGDPAELAALTNSTRDSILRAVLLSFLADNEKPAPKPRSARK